MGSGRQPPAPGATSGHLSRAVGLVRAESVAHSLSFSHTPGQRSAIVVMRCVESRVQAALHGRARLSAHRHPLKEQDVQVQWLPHDTVAGPALDPGPLPSGSQLRVLDTRSSA